MMPLRISIDETLMQIAEVISQRATCSRLAVGCVIAKDTRIISSGWNGALANQIHCLHLDNSPCTQAVHSEENAILYAARAGISTEGTSIYCTHRPCVRCARMIIGSGIQNVFYRNLCRDNSSLEIFGQSGVKVKQLEKS